MTSGTTSFCSFGALRLKCCVCVRAFVSAGVLTFLVLCVSFIPIDVHACQATQMRTTIYSEALRCSGGKSNWKPPSDMYYVHRHTHITQAHRHIHTYITFLFLRCFQLSGKQRHRFVDVVVVVVVVFLFWLLSASTNIHSQLLCVFFASPCTGYYVSAWMS